MTNPESWFNVIELVILALGAFFAIRQLRLQREEVNANALREHRRHSIEIDARLSEFATERQRVEATFPPSEWKEPIPLERLQSAFKDDDRLEPALLRMIEQMEMLVLPVCAKAADEDMAFELVGQTVVKYFTVFRNYIEYRRTIQNRPDFFIYLTAIVDTRWAARDVQERELVSQGALPFFLR